MTPDQFRELTELIGNFGRENDIPAFALPDALANLSAFFAVHVHNVIGTTGEELIVAREALQDSLVGAYDHYCQHLKPQNRTLN